MDPFNDFAFLNGEKEIQTLIILLKKRTNDDLFTPNIIKLQELLKAYKNNPFRYHPSKKTSFELPLIYLKAENEIKRILKKRPEVIFVSRKNFFPQEPSAPEKTKIITCAIIIGVFFGIFIAIIRSGLRILKKTKNLDSP